MSAHQETTPTAPAAPRIRIDFFSAAFCRRCIDTRAVLEQVAALVPGVEVVEHDFVREEETARARGITMTPTVVISDVASDPAGVEVFRAGGVPSLDQALTAVSRALQPPR